MCQHTLIQAPIGVSKTEFLVETIHQHKSNNEIDPVWVLLPSNVQSRIFRENIGKRLTNNSSAFQVYTFLWNSLISKVLDQREEKYRFISTAIRQSLVHMLLHRLNEENKIHYFSKIIDKPGIWKHVINFIDELIHYEITPEHFAAHAISAKDEELALIFQSYEQFLIDYQLLDRVTAVKFTLDYLQNHSLEEKISLFLVNGLDHFTPLQVDLIAALAKNAKKSIITLPDVNSISKNIRSPHLESFELTKERLINSLETNELLLSQKKLPNNLFSKQLPSLEQLTRQLFSITPERTHVDENIEFILAPTEEQEVRTILKDVKQKLIMSDADPEKILLILTSESKYLPYIQAIAREYSIPINIQIKQPLLESPLIKAVFQFLELTKGVFSGQQLIQVVQSPYTKPAYFNEDCLFFLRLVCHDIQGKLSSENWQERINSAEFTCFDEANLSKIKAKTIETLAPFFTVFQNKGNISWYEFLVWLNRLFNLDGHSEDCLIDLQSRRPNFENDIPLEESINSRNLNALEKFGDVVESLIASVDIYSKDGINQYSFVNELEEILRDQYTEGIRTSGNAVFVTSLSEASGIYPDHCYLVGLSEDNHQHPYLNTSLYLLSERKALRNNGLPIKYDEELSKEARNFYQIIASVQKTITLSRTVSVDGAPLAASFFWQAIEDCFTEASVLQRTDKIEFSDSEKPYRVASIYEMPQTRILEEGSEQNTDMIQDRIANSEEVIDRIKWTEFAIDIEKQRLSNDPPNQYSGRLARSETQKEVSNLLSEDYIWSVSQLNELARCGFHYLANRLLKLKPISVSEENLEAVYFGDLIHQILYELYEPFRIEQIPIEPNNQDLALKSIDKIVEKYFQQRDSNYIEFQKRIRSAVIQPMREYFKLQIRRIIETDFGIHSPFLRFGNESRYVTSLESSFEERIFLTESTPTHIRMRGKIDRVDRVGDRYIIIDYKSGNQPIGRSEISQGLDFQLPLYLLAERSKHRNSIIEPRFSAINWHIRKGELRTEIDSVNDVYFLARIRQKIHQILRNVYCGDFSNKPTRPRNHRCTRYCDYFELCRLARMNLHKLS